MKTKEGAETGPQEDIHLRAGPPPNIRFVGKSHEQYGKTIEALPLRKINHGETVIMLPGEGQKADAEAQSLGFYHEDAALIVRLFGHLYKMISNKGGE